MKAPAGSRCYQRIVHNTQFNKLAVQVRDMESGTQCISHARGFGRKSAQAFRADCPDHFKNGITNKTFPHSIWLYTTTARLEYTVCCCSRAWPPIHCSQQPIEQICLSSPRSRLQKFMSSTYIRALQKMWVCFLWCFPNHLNTFVLIEQFSFTFNTRKLGTGHKYETINLTST